MNFIKKQASAAKLKVKNKMSFDATYGQGKTFLHGYLEISVFEARDLPDMEGWVSKLVDKGDVTDSYVDVHLGKARLVRTRVIDNDLNPKFNEDYRVEVCHFANELTFDIKDKDHAYSEFIGNVNIATATLLNGDPVEGWFNITKRSGRSKGQIKLKVVYKSKANLENTYNVEPCYFPMHQNCRVTLYQDACVPKNLPQFANLPVYPASCWHDLYDTIMAAKEVICITGWAVWDKLQLFRGEDLAIDNRTLGEILKDKAKEGVKVWVMVWSEKTSNQVNTQGVMGTHDMDTYNYFQNSGVYCCLAPRELKDSKELTDTLQNQFASGAYTHHQKSVICDAPGEAEARPRLVAFVGGLDLTGGRYDTPNFELFKTLLNEHKGDFRNSNAKVVNELQGPREPWHDIHSKVEGRIAYDVFFNFYERWARQGPQGREFIELKGILDSDINIDGPLNMDPNRSWNVQFFRSITDDSARFLDENRTSCMNSKKGRQVDSSIAQSYIQMIRNAVHFIYIENQYFLGSAYAWMINDDVNCHHTIPSEIAQKICDKIQANEPFCAYIMIPMFPEGDPASAPIQEILYWQTRTIEMMYKRVGDAIKASGNGTHPTDWLIFLCPAKREAAGEHLNNLASPSEPMAQTFRETLRFPIYVHSKMIIVDDAYIIVGSANINQRSMAGTRDTEMAVGCWQPAFPAENPHGDVHQFRMSLWANHFMFVDPSFTYPGTYECISKVKAMANENWKMYMGPVGSVTIGKVISYPLKIEADGAIDTLDEAPTFPDFPPGSSVIGKLSAFIPQKVTT